MLNRNPFDLDTLLRELGEVGHHLAEIGAAEGAAGNLSIATRAPLDPRPRFPLRETIALPQPVPALAGATIIVTGSGRRLREALDDPGGNLACITVHPGGETGEMFTAPNRLFQRVTSEFNSHLAVHYDQMLATGASLHAIVHAQPAHLTYLSHIPRYQDADFLSRRLLRWQPETIINLPEGIGVLEFCIPGSRELMIANVQALREHQLVVWARHGVMARSEKSLKHAADLVEYAETGARYEVTNLSNGEQANGLSPAEIRAIAQSLGIKQRVY